MSRVQYAEGVSVSDKLEAFEKHARRLQHLDKLLAACAEAQEQMPRNTVPGDCGMASLTLMPFGGGAGSIYCVLDSFLGSITNVEFVGEWLTLSFPPRWGFFTNSNTKIIGLGRPKVVLIASIKPGAGNVFANLTLLEATTAGGPCVGLLPSDTKEFK